MKYTIKGKEYTEFDINKRCAELMGLKVAKEQYMHYGDRDENVVLVRRDFSGSSDVFDCCNNPNDTWPIIEKCWDDLTNVACLSTGNLEWHQIVEKHNCTKLVAACICHIEINHSETI